MTIGSLTRSEASLLETWQRDPEAFLIDALGSAPPWERQRDILRSVAESRTTNVVSGHAVGKDWICGRIALWWLYTSPDSIVVTTAPKDEQVRTVLWGEIRSAFHAAPVRLGGSLSPVAPDLRIGPKWYAIGQTANNPNAFAGHHSKRVLLIRDEAAGIPPLIWDAGDGVTSGDLDKVLNIGNPICGPVHPFAKLAAMPDQPGTRRTIWIRSTETPNYIQGRNVIPGLASRAFVQDIADVYGEDSVVYGARVLARFPGGASDGLISLEHLARARERYRSGLRAPQDAVVRLGCDVARFGDDLTRIVARKGPEAWEVTGSPISRMDGVVVAEALAAAARQTNAISVSIDGGGLGSGPIDHLRYMQREGTAPTRCVVHEVQFGAKATDETRWKNRRTELWWRMRDWINDEAAIDPNRTLEEELLAPRYSQKGTWIELESKDDFKKRLGIRSPDYADALALAVSGHLTGSQGFAEITIPDRDADARRSFLDHYRARR